jgi:uncharacterized protein (TIGR03000 family)
MSAFGRAFLVAPLAMALAVGTAAAQHGGGHGGGGHGGGGGHPGGGHPGGGHPGGGHPGGAYYHSGGAYYHPGGGYYHHSYYGGYGYPFIGLGYGGFGYPYSGLGYGGYGYGRPYYGGGYYDNGYYSNGYGYPAGYGYTAPVVPAGYSAGYTPSQPVAPAPVGDPAPATLTVIVPDGAQLWFDGTPSDQTGPRRTFTTPPINPGQTQTVVVKMTTGGGPVTMPLQLRAGDKTTVDLSGIR